MPSTVHRSPSTGAPLEEICIVSDAIMSIRTKISEECFWHLIEYQQKTWWKCSAVLNHHSVIFFIRHSCKITGGSDHYVDDLYSEVKQKIVLLFGSVSSFNTNLSVCSARIRTALQAKRLWKITSTSKVYLMRQLVSVCVL